MNPFEDAEDAEHEAKILGANHAPAAVPASCPVAEASGTADGDDIADMLGSDAESSDDELYG